MTYLSEKDILGISNLGFAGMSVVQDEWVYRTVTKKEKRSWRERLFSLPWKPLLQYRLMIFHDISVVYQVGNSLVCHPEMMPHVLCAINGEEVAPIKEWLVLQEEKLSK
jgi:hypothetical protein